MGKKNKTPAATSKETTMTSSQRTVNSSVTARNLRSDKLAGAILGCTHKTLRECYTQLLFGLPAGHFSYIRNIKQGMPLFLFNYSDRKIHGIFEAVSSGQMNINPRGWTADASELTPYPAQVRVKVRKLCEPVVEELFKPVLAKNYYAEPTHFWFELDSTQTTQLIQLFSFTSARRATSSMLTPTQLGHGKMEKPSSMLQASAPQKQGQATCSNVGWGSKWNEGDPDVIHKGKAKQIDMHQFSAGDLRNSCTATTRPWNSLFKESSARDDTSNNNEDLKKKGTEEKNMSYSEHYRENEVAGNPSFVDDGSQYEDMEDFVEQLLGSELSCENVISDATAAAEEGASSSDVKNRPAAGSSSNKDKMVKNSDPPASFKRVSAECSFSTSEGSYSAKTKFSDIEWAVAKLTQEMEELKASQATQTRRINYLEQELIESTREVKRLQDQCKMLQCRQTHVSNAIAEETDTDVLRKPWPRLREFLIVLMQIGCATIFRFVE